MKQIELIKIILKNSHINFLLGAGTSYNRIDGKLHYPLMRDLIEYVKENEQVKEFYQDVKQKNGIAQLISEIFDKYLYEEGSNVEKFLSVFEGVDLYVHDQTLRKLVLEGQALIKNVIRQRIMEADCNTVLEIYIDFYNGLRQLKELSAIKNQTFNIFTTNYDMLNEMAMENLNIHYYSGFEGVIKRKFNLAYYNYSYMDNFTVNRSKVEFNPEHINLYKLHGSLSWHFEKGELIEKNPYEQNFLPEIIYPSVDKFNNTTLIINYSALMREFSSRVCRKDTALFVSGMSMGDEHINKIIENALTINSFHLVIFGCGEDAVIQELKNKYKTFKNVIVLDESYTFKQVAELLLSVQGGNINA